MQKGKGIEARGGAIAGDLVCLRPCAASGASSPAKKRPIDLDPMANMVFQAPFDEFHAR